MYHFKMRRSPVPVCWRPLHWPGLALRWPRRLHGRWGQRREGLPPFSRRGLPSRPVQVSFMQLLSDHIIHTANWPNSSEPPQNKIFRGHLGSKTMATYPKNRLPCKIWASKSAAPARYRAFRGKINYHFFAWFGLADQKFDTKNQFLVESRPKKKKNTTQKYVLWPKLCPKNKFFSL